MIRSFIAIELPTDTKNALGELLEGLKTYGPRVSWVKKENIHLTIKFLGNIHEQKIKQIKEIMEKATKDIPHFSLKPIRLGAFPDSKRPRVIWVGLSGEIALLEKFYVNLEKGLETLGFEREERKFKPHFTLGRVKKASHGERLAEAIAKYSNFSTPSFLVQDIVLFKSELHPQGAKYTALERVDLKKLEEKS